MIKLLGVKYLKYNYDLFQSQTQNNWKWLFCHNYIIKYMILLYTYIIENSIEFKMINLPGVNYLKYKINNCLMPI